VYYWTLAIHWLLGIILWIGTLCEHITRYCAHSAVDGCVFVCECALAHSCVRMCVCVCVWANTLTKWSIWGGPLNCQHSIMGSPNCSGPFGKEPYLCRALLEGRTSYLGSLPIVATPYSAMSCYKLQHSVSYCNTPHNRQQLETCHIGLLYMSPAQKGFFWTNNSPMSHSSLKIARLRTRTHTHTHTQNNITRKHAWYIGCEDKELKIHSTEEPPETEVQKSKIIYVFICIHVYINDKEARRITSIVNTNMPICMSTFVYSKYSSKQDFFIKCVCVNVYVLCVYVEMFAHTYIYFKECMCVCICIVHICIHTCRQTFVYTWTCIHTPVNRYICTYACVCMCLCARVYMSACVHDIYISCIYPCAHMYGIHTQVAVAGPMQYVEGRSAPAYAQSGYYASNDGYYGGINTHVTLQRTATHCNTLQHDTLQHTDTMQHMPPTTAIASVSTRIPHCNAMQYTRTH